MPIFHDEESLLYKINYFLENEFLRKKIAIQANSHYSLNYSYPNSLINLFKQISEKLDNDKIKDNHKLIMPQLIILKGLIYQPYSYLEIFLIEESWIRL